MRRFLVMILLAALTISWTASPFTSPAYGAEDKLSLLVKDISALGGFGAPGELELLSDAWIPIAAGDSSYTPSVFAATAAYNKGHVLAIGSESLLSDSCIGSFNNLSFTINSINYLGSTNINKKIAYTSGHGELLGGDKLNTLKTALEKNKLQLTMLSSPITAASLKDIGVLVIGNACNSFSEQELISISSFVGNGGGLLLCGSSQAYLSNNPDKQLGDYPMNMLAKVLGIRWISPAAAAENQEAQKADTGIRSFYPAIKIYSVNSAISYISSTTKEQNIYLRYVLESDANLRNNYIKALNILKTAASGPDSDEAVRARIYSLCKELVTLYPQQFSKTYSLDSKAHPTMTWIRDVVFRIWIDSAELTKTVKEDIAASGKITGVYLTLWNNNGIYVADNCMLDDTQKKVLLNMFSMVPEKLHNIRIVSVADYLGTKPEALDFSGKGASINISGSKVGQYWENPFNSSASSTNYDAFSLRLFHEINHVIDTYYVDADAKLKEDKQKLLKYSGDDSRNYLGKYADGYFIKAPQEFFPSLSNPWIADSAKSIQLGLTMFNKGMKPPINQALFFARIYGGTDFTYFYTTDKKGYITQTSVPMYMNSQGRIEYIQFDKHTYTFTYDDKGNVSSCKSSSIGSR